MLSNGLARDGKLSGSLLQELRAVDAQLLVLLLDCLEVGEPHIHLLQTTCTESVKVPTSSGLTPTVAVSPVASAKLLDKIVGVRRTHQGSDLLVLLLHFTLEIRILSLDRRACEPAR